MRAGHRVTLPGCYMLLQRDCLPSATLISPHWFTPKPVPLESGNGQDRTADAQVFNPALYR